MRHQQQQLLLLNEIFIEWAVFQKCVCCLRRSSKGWTALWMLTIQPVGTKKTKKPNPLPINTVNSIEQ